MGKMLFTYIIGTEMFKNAYFDNNRRGLIRYPGFASLETLVLCV